MTIEAKYYVFGKPIPGNTQGRTGRRIRVSSKTIRDPALAIEKTYADVYR
jgi:hypothetical protein